MEADTTAAGTAEQDAEPFADGTPLVRLFGGGARSRILAVLVDERTRDLSISEIARQAGIARKTVYDHIDDLVDLGGAVVARETKQGRRYSLAETPVGQKLYELDGVLLRQIVEDSDAKSEES